MANREVIEIIADHLDPETIKEIVEEGDTAEMRYFGAKCKNSSLKEELKTVRNQIFTFLRDESVDYGSRQKLFTLTFPKAASIKMPGKPLQFTEFLDRCEEMRASYKNQSLEEIQKQISFYAS